MGLQRCHSSANIHQNGRPPSFALCRAQSIPNLTAHVLSAATYKPGRSSGYFGSAHSSSFFPYYYPAYSSPHNKPPYHKIGEPDLIYNPYSLYYRMPYRRFYFASLHLPKNFHYPLNYFGKFRGYCCTRDYHYPMPSIRRY